MVLLLQGEKQIINKGTSTSSACGLCMEMKQSRETEIERGDRCQEEQLNVIKAGHFIQ